MEKQVHYSWKDATDLDVAEVTDLHRQYLNSGYVRMMDLMDYGLVFEKAEGCLLHDLEGNEYLDVMGGYGSLNLGHNHPVVLQSLQELVGKPNLSLNSLSPYAAVLAAKLAQETDGYLTRSFFCSSGSEAVEAALKLARVATGKRRFVYCTDAFHGKSLGALSVAGRENYRAPYAPLLPDCLEIPFGDASALEEVLLLGDVAAFIVEPIQGEGGVHVPPAGYFRQVRALCTQYEALLILDEVQTGLGRTGCMFAYEYEEIVPDVLCLAKSLGGGIMPIGACITTDELHQRAYGDITQCLLHSATFGGNAYACAAALATLDTLHGDQLIEECEAKGSYLLERLHRLKEAYACIKDVRGRGLLLGLEFHRETTNRLLHASADGLQHIIEGNYAVLVAVRMLKEHRILTGYSPNNPDLIRIEPPLTISYSQLDQFVDALECMLRSFAHAHES
ncbi:aspartate aminotransferase family protein [Paenibacillus massiliensis]|uniref:aspartate aminotransferase family protein n=1 Tax=Paenibacillus massiliensis TaxID=225917 RepID=UPI00036E7BE3|nr:aspartate aminotransferase family protein [Paenibacillus massiliensis]